MLDLLADAQAWRDRAGHHIAEYEALAHAPERPVWSLPISQREDGAFVYALARDHALVSRLKPLAAEAACALFQVLDHVIAVGARQSGVARNLQVSWPFALEADPDAGLLGHLRPAIGGKLQKLGRLGMTPAWLALIEESFDAHRTWLAHIDVVKEVSNLGKHWELVPTDSEALAISWRVGGVGQETIHEIPLGHFADQDRYVFHEGPAIPAGSFQILLRSRLAVDGKDFKPEPETAFRLTTDFVETALAKARALLG